MTETTSRVRSGPGPGPGSAGPGGGGRDRRQVPGERSRLRRHAPWLTLAVAQVLLVIAPGVPGLRPALALATLLGVPTVVLARRAGFPTDSVPARWLYAFGASLLTILVIGLALNTVLPWVGVDHPLHPVVLAITWFLVDAGLLMWRPHIALMPPHSLTSVARRALEARFELAEGLAALALLFAVIGAVRLNNGLGGAAALLAHCAAAAAIVALMVRRAGSTGRDLRTLWLVAASMLLATSLRGWGITGHDIQAEYLAFTLTNDAQRWQVSWLESAYNACLSITILPTILAQQTGLSGVVVFKVLLQLVFALVPVMTFLLARRFLPRALALMAATLTLAFPTFATDMPYLVRQEIAFFFLGLSLLAMSEPTASRRWTRTAVVILGAGVVLSHYATTYLMLMGLVLALVAVTLLRLVGRGRWRVASVNPFDMVLLNPVVVALLVALSLAWAGPITGTGAHASDVVRATVDAVFGDGSDTPGSSDARYRLFAGETTTPRERLDKYVTATLDYRAEKLERGELVVPQPTKAELHPRIIPPTKSPPTVLGRALDSVSLDPGKLNPVLKLAAAAVMQVLLCAGLLWLLRRRHQNRVPPEFVLLCFGTVAALGLVVLVPNLSVAYGVLRAFQQAMLVVAPVMAAGLWLMLRPLGRRLRWLLVATPLALLLVLGGVLPTLLGGNEPRLALANAGTYHDRFSTSDPEQQAITWVATTDANVGYSSKIISNRNVLVKLLTATGNAAPVADRLYPTLLTKDAYVFVDSQIMLQGRSTIFYTGDLITYRYPLDVLDRNLNLVYSAPGVRIYR